MTAFLYAAKNTNFQLVNYLLSSEGGASITETDEEGNTALLLAAGYCCPPMVQWLLEYGGAQITGTNNEETSFWTVPGVFGLPAILERAYKKGRDGECVHIDEEYVPNEAIIALVPYGNIGTLTSMLRVMVLHGEPQELLAHDLAPPFQRIMEYGARLRARLPAYLAQRRALLLDGHCPLLPPLHELVHGYERPTGDELWAWGTPATR
jgi:hypothetical protein